MDSEVSYSYDLEKQTECYNTLITEGGRPSHPVSLGRDILENPGEHHEILSYWQLVSDDAEGRTWEVFEPQYLSRSSQSPISTRQGSKVLESIKRRNNLVSEFIEKTKSYRISKHDAERRSILLRWILEQVPFIELELDSSEAAEIGSNGRNDGKRRSKRNCADDFSEEQVSKR
ncbi:hypothetical protein IFR05_006846 [Cadophora sp. M221]|nr:hypothetical protein IFR05_006846 [Cadophora sp. M221]